MRRFVPLALAIAVLTPTSEAFARGFKFRIPAISAGARPAAAPAARSVSRTVVAPLPGRRTSPEEQRPSLSPALTAPAPAVVQAAQATEPTAPTRAGWRNPKQTAEEFRSSCGASHGAVVGAGAGGHGFCVVH